MQAILEKITAPMDSAFLAFVRDDQAFAFRWHFHAECELTLILKGRGQRFVGDHIDDYRPGDLVLLGQNLPHTWASAPGRGRHRALVIQFRRDALSTAPELQGIDRLLTRAQQGLQVTGRTRRQVTRELLQLHRQEGLPRFMTLLRVLDLLARSRELRVLSSAGFRPALRQGDQARIDQVWGYIHAHVTDRLESREVAKLMHLSPRTLTRLFRRTLGKTFLEYVHELRIGRACEMLIHTDKTVTEICYATGFNNLAHFNRKFRALKSRTPRAYRHAYAGAAGINARN